MSREIQSIPPAPRQVRWHAVLWYRWALGLCAFVFGVYGGAVTWMLFLAFGAMPSDNARLDHEPVVLAKGVVKQLLGQGGTYQGAPADRWKFHFRYVKPGEPEQASEPDGTCFAAAGKFHVDDTVDVELLPDEPNRNRIVGTRLDLLQWWLKPQTWFAILVVPGFLFLLAWLVNAFRLRQMMALGDVGVAQVLMIHEVRWVLPSMLCVRFSFRDHHAAPREGQHWVRSHSPLGQRLLQQLRNGTMERMPVLHDRRWPQFSRLALPADFVHENPSSPSSPSKESLPL